MRKGQKHTRQAIAKIRAANIGKIESAETRAKKRAFRLGKPSPMLGRTHSIEARTKIRAAKLAERNPMFGKTRSAEARAKTSAALLGCKNPAWRGGISCLPYTWVFNETLKSKIRERDAHTCQFCKIPETDCGQALDVHHIDYDKTNSESANLIALCHSCHSKTGTHRKHWMRTFGIGFGGDGAKECG